VAKESGRHSWRLRASIALALAVGALGASASAAQALPANFWGVVPQTALNTEQFQRLATGGVETIRLPIGWGTAQPARGAIFNWSDVDPQVAAAARAGITVLPFLSDAPSWAVPSVPVPGSGGSVRAPAHLPVGGVARSGWIGFVTAAVARYGPNGSFWAENPTVPRRPVRTWQIWNEENFKYFVAKPNPAEYGKLVKISSKAIKGADPGAKIVLGGLFAEPLEATKKYRPPRAYFATDFLQQMYLRAPGVKASFNGVALHPYSPNYQRLTPAIEAFRAVLVANRDAGKGLWITELGWSSQPKTAGNSFAKGVAGQAAQLRGAFSLLKSRQRKWKVRGVYWFSVDDHFGSCNFCDGSGLFSDGFEPKRSWYSYVKFAGGTP
jgi:hypothetical protein